MSLYNDKTCALVTEADAVAILVAMTAICFNTQPRSYLRGSLAFNFKQ